MGWAIPIGISLVFLGCCSNVVFLELIIKEDPGAGNIITFFQFLFISLEGLIFVSKFLSVSPKIPLKEYMLLVGLYFFISVINNYALNFNVPLPLHMIFRAGSLIANMIMGVLLLKKSYSLSKYVAVIMITIGIAVATFASAQDMTENAENVDSFEEGSSVVTLTIGIIMLLTALFCSARLGLFQEVMYKEYGKHPREAMFYTHALPLPAFAIFAPDIWSKMISFSASEPIIVMGSLVIPKMWLYILGNCITQYICIRGVFILTTECPSLYVTLVVTLRKFVSLLFSIFYFKNPFTVRHWVATLLVFMGTALFTGVLSALFGVFLPSQKTREEVEKRKRE